MSNWPATGLASMTRGILRWAERQGIELSRVIGSNERERLARAGDEGRVPRALHEAVWRGVENVVADPAFGLKSAPSILEASSFGLVGMLAMTSDTVGASIARSMKYSRVLKDDLELRVRVDDDLVVELWTERPMTRAMADASVYAFRHFSEAWTRRPVTPRAVFFRHHKPGDVREYERFGCTVHFSQPVDAIVLDRELCGVPLLTARPEVNAYLERMADGVLGAQRGSPELRSRAHAALRESIAEGRSDLETIAHKLGTSGRSLQRALQAEGLSYRDLVDEVRWSLAAPLVASSEMSIEQIAERLGYADGKAFRRAFRRWAGTSPSILRRAQRRR